jgi:peptidyl-prolyl cis-trans isomerase C
MFNLFNIFIRKPKSGKRNVAMSNTAAFEVRASHLLVGSREEAEQCRQEILDGKTFAEVAKRVSKCPSGAQGGDLGFFGRGRMVPQFDQVAFELPVGELSEPVQTQFGWHILTVTDKK